MNISSEKTDLKTILGILKEQHNVKGKALFMPLRIALTGQTHGPELGPIFNLMPQDIKMMRLNSLLTLLEG